MIGNQYLYITNNNYNQLALEWWRPPPQQSFPVWPQHAACALPPPKYVVKTKVIVELPSTMKI